MHEALMQEEYTEEEKALIREQLREANRLAREVVKRRGIKLHPRIASIRAERE